MSANASAPRELAALFVPYMYLLQLDPVEHAATFAAGVVLFLSPCRVNLLLVAENMQGGNCPGRKLLHMDCTHLCASLCV